MSKIARIVLGLFIGYALGAALGYGAIHVFSGNVHDKELEAVMTAFFATGPLVAALGVVVALVMGRRG